MGKGYRLLLTTVNFIIYLAVIALWISIPEEIVLNISVTAFNLILSGIILFLFRKSFSAFYKSAFFKNLSSSIISGLLILSILGLVNYLFYSNPVQVDITDQKWNTLSKESLNIVEKVEDKLTAHVFGKKQQERAFRSFLDRYRFENNNIKILFHDVQLRPDLVNKHNIKKDGVIQLEYLGKTLEVAQITELEMAKTISKLIRTKDPVIYYLSGLNNLDLNASDAQGGLVLKRALIDSSYKLEIQDIHKLKSIPKEVKSIIIWGPKVDLTKDQLLLVDNYLKNGGTLVTAIDPNLNKTIASNYREYLKTIGIEISNNLVIDNKSAVNGSNGIVPLIQKIKNSHEIVESQPVPIFFPLTSSVLSTAVENEDFNTLIQTSSFPHSWAENRPKTYATKEHAFDSTEDRPGPITIAAAIENKKENWRVTAFGSSTFVQNNYSNYTNNFKLFTSSIAWLVEKDNNLILNLPVFKEVPIFISSPQIGIIFYFSVVFMPLLLFGFAVYSYRKRQSL